MIFKTFLTIFFSVFCAELGDKTQLATILFATNKDVSKILVFAASALALVIASALAVLLGNVIAKYINPKYLTWLAGVGFIIIGIWTIAKA